MCVFERKVFIPSLEPPVASSHVYVAVFTPVDSFPLELQRRCQLGGGF